MDDIVNAKGDPSATSVTPASAQAGTFNAPPTSQLRTTAEPEQNITPLHWAAINAQVAACRYLLEQGAEVDALGGDLVATPMQWAARGGTRKATTRYTLSLIHHQSCHCFTSYTSLSA
ncbi:hypothetical protein DENSPDRAFT_444704 [Dentipellis sp. KUC8613]|nr:hypothetical protein DENSPDRAFT_444704 [Dentipellis sp. KUC8613]